MDRSATSRPPPTTTAKSKSPSQSNTHANPASSVPQNLQSSTSLQPPQPTFNDQIDHRPFAPQHFSQSRQSPSHITAVNQQQQLSQDSDRDAYLSRRSIPQNAFRQDYPGMQISSTLNLLHGGASSALPHNTTSSGPMTNANNVQGGPYQQSGQYTQQIHFSQQHMQQGGANGMPSGNPNVSAAFSSTQLQPHQGMHQQGLPGAHTHMQNFTNTGAITGDNILPASVVTDPSAPTSNQFTGQGDALNSSNPWNEAHPAISSVNSRYRVQQSYGQHGIPHRQQSGMLPPFANARNGAPGSSMGLAQNTGLHSTMNGHGVLGQMGGPLTNMTGLQQGPGLSGSQNLVPIGLGQQYGEDGTGGRSYGQIDVMGNTLRATGKIGRPYEHHSTGYPHSIGNITGLHNLSDVPVQNLGDPSFNSVVKTEDSSACGPRRQRSRKRGNKPPGQPSIPVHLRNPKKGRARVFRKCQYCNQDNHIRRSTCDHCKQALPAGKRRRDGNLAFQREHVAKQRNMVTASAVQATSSTAPYTTGTAPNSGPRPAPPPMPSTAPHPADVNGVSGPN